MYIYIMCDIGIIQQPMSWILLIQHINDLNNTNTTTNELNNTNTNISMTWILLIQHINKLNDANTTYQWVENARFATSVS